MATPRRVTTVPVQKSVATSTDLAASGKLAPQQGVAAAKKPKRKKLDPESTEGKALKSFVEMILDDDEIESIVAAEKAFNPSQPRAPDGKFAPSGSASDGAGHDNPFIKPSGNSAPAATGTKEEHAEYHAKEMFHQIKQQFSAYQAGDTKSGDQIGHLVDAHSIQYQHYSGVKTVKGLLNDVEVEKTLDELAIAVQEARAAAVVPIPNDAVTVQKSIYCQFVTKDEAPDKQLVTGIVLVPECVDAQGDIYDAEVIEKAAHAFMSKYNAGTKIGHLHKEFNRPLELVESYCAPADMAIGDKAIVKGTWLMTVKVKDPTLWSDVKDGKLQGFSIGGIAKVTKLD